MRSGKKRVLGRMDYDGMVKIYETTLAAAINNVVIPGLNGNIDQEYRLVIRSISGNDTASVALRFNADSGNNYGIQSLTGLNTTAAATRPAASGSALLTVNGASGLTGDKNLSVVDIHAKSGFVRTGICRSANIIVTTTVATIELIGFAWNNTADNITSISIIGNVADSMAIGTNIQLFARRSKV